MSNYRIIPRHDTKANWQTNNPILLKGEIGNVDDNPNLYKIGDGTSRWNDLPFRGYNGTVADRTGNDENSVMSQKVVTEIIAAVDSRLTELEKSQFPLTVATTLSSTLLEYTGVAQTVVVSYNVKRKGVPVVPESLKAMIDAVVVSLTAASSGSYNTTVNKNGQTSIAIQAVKDGMTATETKTVQMLLPIYAGFGKSATDVVIDANKLSVRTSAAGTYTKTAAADGVNFFILVPATFAKLTSFTMGGTPLVMETSTITAGSFNKSYTQYKSIATYNTGATVNIKAS